MSSGTFTRDSRVPVNTVCGVGFSGSVINKTWAGGDDPVNHKENNPYDMTYSEVRDGIILWAHDSNPTFFQNGTWTSCFGGASCEALAWSSNDDLSLLNKLGDEIRKHEFNAAVAVGAEGKEALEQIADAATRVYKGMRHLRKGQVPQALRQFGLSPSHAKRVGLHKDLSGKVLATQLGWLPLMGSVKDAAEAYKALTEKPQSMTYHARRSIKSSCYPPGDSKAICGDRIISKKLTWTLSENFTKWESLSISNPWDLATMVYNATTLSFIADWFIPIGSYLTARSLLATLKGSGFITTYERTQYRGLSKFGHYTVKNGDAYFFKTLHVQRTPLSSLSGLVALPKLKDFDKVPSLQRALTALTLATQMFK